MIGQAQPDEPEPVDGIASRPDLVGVLIRHSDAEVGDILGRLAQGGTVDPAECEGRLVPKQRRGDSRPLGRGYEFSQGILNGHDALIQRQRLQIGGRQVQAFECVDRCAGAARRIGQFECQLLGGGRNLVH